MQPDRRELLLAGNLNSLVFKFSIPAMVAMVVNALAITALSIILPVQLIIRRSVFIVGFK